MVEQTPAPAGSSIGEPLVSLAAVWRTVHLDPPLHAVRDVSFDVKAGTWWSVTGASGSGKSTLLNLIGCLDRPTEGTYRFAGLDVGAMGEGELAGLRATRLGFVFQSFHLLPTRSAVENVMLADLYRRGDRSTRFDRARAALERVGLEHRAESSVTTLSGGERQRVAIARAILGGPDLLLCDEPTGNLDSRTTSDILEVLAELHATGQTLLVVTHEPDVAARSQGEAAMADGELTVTRPTERTS